MKRNRYYIDVVDYNRGVHEQVAAFPKLRECVRHIREGGWEEPDWSLLKTLYIVRSAEGGGMIEAVGQYRMATLDESSQPVLMFNFLDPLLPGEVYYYEHEYRRFLVDEGAASAGGGDVGAVCWESRKVA